MSLLRILIRDHPRTLLALVVLCFCIRATIPLGYMITPSSDTFFQVTLCPEFAPAVEQAHAHHAGADHGSGHLDDTSHKDHCAYSGLAMVSLGGADPILLALAFAILVFLGLAPTPRLHLRQFSNLRPPPRGPPAAL